ncbi:hypothetical protein [uncultured Methanobrevibacter sp.]|nr:hypothetical protein [uncultured Methanobrevibacter sp.]
MNLTVINASPKKGETLQSYAKMWLKGLKTTELMWNTLICIAMILKDA